MALSLSDDPHRRYNPLTGEWVLVSPHRAKRPWQGRIEATADDNRPRYDPSCYLCPGNTRAGGVVNPDYRDTFIFDNDFGALLPGTEDSELQDGKLLRARAERGICRVICFSPRHDLTLPEMEVAAIRRVVDVWTEQYEELGAKSFINHVQIFENKGETMGCSNPHPHGQIWAQGSVPGEPAKELHHFKAYHAAQGSTLLADYLDKELELETRIVCANDGFVALVPFWAFWPFETMILPRRRIASLSEMEPAEKDALADLLKRLTSRYDNLFRTSFPYSAGLHQAPTDGEPHPEWDFHLHFYPPLLRSATVRKFMVGYEMLANPQRDITPETSADMLRALPEIHYKAA
ncbi:MAG: UDP-glucose--hexose-1-phosphate uridylyltransferase [Pseudomonadota bacterium]